MNNTPTPRTDAAAWPETDLVEGNFARILERELATVTEQLKAAHDGWHDEITKGLTELRRAESIYTKAQERAERAEEQRDRLAEALDRISRPIWWMQEDQKRATGSINGINGSMAASLSESASYLKSIAAEALQSINQTTP